MKKQPKMGFGVWVTILVVVLVGALALLIATQDSGDDEGTDFEVAESVQVSGDALPELVSSSDDPAQGQSAPTASSVDFDGSATSIQADGNAKIVVFLAHWCPHCQAEVPGIEEWLASGAKPEGLDVVFVPTATNESRPNYPPSAWLEDEGILDQDVTVVVDDGGGTLAGAYGLNAFPYWAALDSEGNVLVRGSGEGTLSPESLTEIAGALT